MLTCGYAQCDGLGFQNDEILYWRSMYYIWKYIKKYVQIIINSTYHYMLSLYDVVSSLKLFIILLTVLWNRSISELFLIISLRKLDMQCDFV